MKRPLLSWLLFAGSAVCCAGTIYIVGVYGKTAYFLVFHRPLHVSLLARHVSPPAAALPTFRVATQASTPTLHIGEQQTVTVRVTPGTTTLGFLEVWIESPDHRQVFRSPLDEQRPQRFEAGKQQAFTFSYRPAAQAPKGVYHVSEIITSPDTFTDYDVHINVDSFTLM